MGLTNPCQTKIMLNTALLVSIDDGDDDEGKHSSVPTAAQLIWSPAS
jgi:hypothetical protein